MATRIEWVGSNTRLLRQIAEEFRGTQPFAGMTIGTGIHLEPKTVALLLTLKEGGAKLVATGNLNTTQADAVAYLRERGITVIGEATRDPIKHLGFLKEVLASKPDILLDNGGDLFDLWRQNPNGNLLGGTEETTSGRARLEPLRSSLNLPILVINDSPIKQFAENEHAVGQSVLESYMRITNRVTNGQRVTVFGYGACGRGVAENFKGAHAKVSVVDRDPLKRLQAHLDGYDTPSRDEAIASADFIVTVTGGGEVQSASDLPLFKSNVILANAGHFPTEINNAAITGSPEVVSTDVFSDGIASLTLRDGRTIHIIAEGHMFNLAGARPLGNSIESMDLGFALQARCLEAVALRRVDATSCVVPVPRDIDERVANAYLDHCYGPAQ
ncbi:adenosylhomocysteinase [Pleomorphomonas sp. PLEO]|uniref:adenosylhomocysteinase n=1 Tax=Pleomorphomonas sp. PLEO TaxID=3239306 RepID=UPI00351EA57F